MQYSRGGASGIAEPESIFIHYPKVTLSVTSNRGHSIIKHEETQMIYVQNEDGDNKKWN